VIRLIHGVDALRDPRVRIRTTKSPLEAEPPGIQSPTRQGLDRILATRGLKFQPMMEFDNVETLKQAVEINAGIAFLPHSAIAAEVASGALVVLPHQGPEIIRPLGIVSRASRVVSPAVKRFLKALKTPRKTSATPTPAPLLAPSSP
jgi:DNA-binding transcriptional LysR family regulator